MRSYIVSFVILFAVFSTLTYVAFELSRFNTQITRAMVSSLVPSHR